MTSQRKDRIRALLKGIETGDAAAVAVVNPDKYIQHNPQMADGSEVAAHFHRTFSESFYVLSGRMELWTGDEPDYDVLMQYRLDVLDEHGLSMPLIADVIGGLGPLPGAREFLDELRRQTQVIVLSDTFEQFAAPLMPHLGMPTVFCHRLVVADDEIVDYRLRQPDQKRKAVQAFHGLNYRVIAAGDSYNDTTMLSEADHGYLFRAPANVIEEFPQFPALEEYDELLERIISSL